MTTPQQAHLTVKRANGLQLKEDMICMVVWPKVVSYDAYLMSTSYATYYYDKHDKAPRIRVRVINHTKTYQLIQCGKQATTLCWNSFLIRCLNGISSRV